MATAISTMTPSTRDAVHSSMHQKPKYTFDQQDYHMKSVTAAANANTRKHRRHQRTNSDDADPTDGSGSLTYSAASSINSAGESTDSSFADIMKVLDMQDPSELGPLMKEKGMSPAEYHMHLQQQHANYPDHHHHKTRSSQASVASSLQYSTDGESNFLHGTDLVSTITGQPSDSMANDGGSYNAESDVFDISMFAPADPTDSIKKRKKEKKSRSRDSACSNSRSSPKVESMQSMSSVNTSKQGSTATIRHKNNATPPPIPRNKSKPVEISMEDDVCYAEWWMSCFPDAFKEMMPKR